MHLYNFVVGSWTLRSNNIILPYTESITIIAANPMSPTNNYEKKSAMGGGGEE